VRPVGPLIVDNSEVVLMAVISPHRVAQLQC
jgi:adenylylsulfate kinase-like enzyme